MNVLWRRKKTENHLPAFLETLKASTGCFRFREPWTYMSSALDRGTVGFLLLALQPVPCNSKQLKQRIILISSRVAQCGW